MSSTSAAAVQVVPIPRSLWLSRDWMKIRSLARSTARRSEAREAVARLRLGRGQTFIDGVGQPDPVHVMASGEEVDAVLARLAHHRLVGLTGHQGIDAERPRLVDRERSAARDDPDG